VLVPQDIIGIDYAVEDKNVGVTNARLTDGTLEILQVWVGDGPGSVLTRLANSCAGITPILLALDAPLGWPAALGPALVEHTAGCDIPMDANRLFRRRTDECVKQNLNRQSLDVGADKIARTAHAAMRLLNELGKRLSVPIPLAWNPQITRTAATLVAYGIPTPPYKSTRPELARKASEEVRKEILQRLGKLLTFRCPLDLLVRDDNALDSTICALAGADFLRGDAKAPDDQALAAKEGWIWARLRSSALAESGHPATA
jgi:hypothetical protein